MRHQTLPPIFDAGEVVVAARLHLSRLTAEALEPMTAWAEAALAPDWGLDDLRRAVEVGSGVLVADADGSPIGIAVVLLDTPAAGAASVPFLAIDPARRFRGLGGEAGLALERHLRRKYAVEAVYAPVSDGRGLAVYFWLRLGYRPLTTLDAPWPLAGLAAESRPGIWLVRDRD